MTVNWDMYMPDYRTAAPMGFAVEKPTAQAKITAVDTCPRWTWSEWRDRRARRYQDAKRRARSRYRNVP